MKFPNNDRAERRFFVSPRVFKKIFFAASVLVLAVVLCPIIPAKASTQTVEVGTAPVYADPELFLDRTAPTVGDSKLAVFLIEFPDMKNENPLATTEYYEDVYFDGGIRNTWGNELSVAQFYDEQSGGRLKISGRVFDWYTAKHERSYYDDKKAEMVAEVAQYYLDQGVDLSEFDGDGDGYIDNIAYHFAGDYSTLQNDPWYTGLAYSGPAASGQVGDLKFSGYAQLYESASVGDTAVTTVVCHELLHTFGMYDLYGTAVLGMSPVVDLMTTNAPVINPYFKIMLGWVDSVRIVTENETGIRLNKGEFVIVTDEFKGFYDEFYIVAYRGSMGNAAPVVYHVDARLNDEGTAFLNNNLFYDPLLDTSIGHDRYEYDSEYLFMEELSASPYYDRVVNNAFIYSDSAFGKDSVLGPDSIPSSDTHDGDFTGIRMENFDTHDGEYMTFDLSVVTDTTPPALLTGTDDLSFSESVTLYFNEYVYKGDAWDDIRILDNDGAPLDATVTITRYPRHTMKITFKDGGYADGYSIVFPEGALRDSAGNGMKAVTLRLSKDDFLFPVDETQLPSIGEIDGEVFRRYNIGTEFFHHENDIVVIAPLGSSSTAGVPKLEFMKLGKDGDVLVRKIIDLPFEECNISYVKETGDGGYVFFCTPKMSSTVDLMFGIDKDGNYLWTNDSYHDTTAYFYGYSAFKYKEGIAFRMITYASGEFDQYVVVVDPKTGEFSRFADISFEQMFNLSGNRLLRVTVTHGTVGKTTRWEMIDGDTYESLAYVDHVGRALSNDYTVMYHHDNGDGTLMIGATVGEELFVFLLDAEMNVVRTVNLGNGLNNDINWIENDGFCQIKIIQEVDHEDTVYRVYRYDRYFNLLWKEDVTANFIHHFKNSSGEMMAYKSLFSPIRECYIVSYGSEDERKTAHEHSLTHVDAREATCLKPGFCEYWQCEGCGCRFFDEGETLIIDISPLVTPATGHTEQIIPAVSASCIQKGNTEGVMCSVCEEILVAPREIPMWSDHSFYGWETTKKPDCSNEGERKRVCSGCGKTETEVIPKDPDKHSESTWTIEVKATCITDGLEVCKCDECGSTLLSSVIHADKIYHKFPASWTLAKESTCASEGLWVKKCAVCEEEQTKVIPVDTKKHTFDDEGWTVVTEATCGDEGEKTNTCLCGAVVDSEIIPATGDHDWKDWETASEPTCMKGGKDIRMCDSCGQWEERSVPRDENNHRFSNYSILTKATCKSEGVEVGHCLCGAEDRRSVPVDRKAHSYGEWLVEKEATCGSKGELRQTCAECGAFQTKRIPENGDHVLGKWETVIRPTCTDGEERCSCACGKRYETRVIPAKEDHRFGEWKTTLAPDVGVWGSEIRECVNCHETEKRAIAPLDPPDISDPSPDDPSDSEDQNGNYFGGLVSWLLGGATVGALAVVGIVAVGVTVVGATVGGVVLIIVRVIAKRKR